VLGINPAGRGWLFAAQGDAGRRDGGSGSILRIAAEVLGGDPVGKVVEGVEEEDVQSCDRLTPRWWTDTSSEFRVAEEDEAVDAGLRLQATGCRKGTRDDSFPAAKTQNSEPGTWN